MMMMNNRPNFATYCIDGSKYTINNEFEKL